jgi:hypothetical protein
MIAEGVKQAHVPQTHQERQKANLQSLGLYCTTEMPTERRRVGSVRDKDALDRSPIICSSARNTRILSYSLARNHRARPRPGRDVTRDALAWSSFALARPGPGRRTRMPWQMARHSCLAAAGTDVRAARERDRDDKGWDWGERRARREGVSVTHSSAPVERAWGLSFAATWVMRPPDRVFNSFTLDTSQLRQTFHFIRDGTFISFSWPTNRFRYSCNLNR